MKLLNPRTFVGGLLLWLALTAIWIAFVKALAPTHADRVDVLDAITSTSSKLSGVYWGIWLVWIRRKKSDVKAVTQREE